MPTYVVTLKSPQGTPTSVLVRAGTPATAIEDVMKRITFKPTAVRVEPVNFEVGCDTAAQAVMRHARHLLELESNPKTALQDIVRSDQWKRAVAQLRDCVADMEREDSWPGLRELK